MLYSEQIKNQKLVARCMMQDLSKHFGQEAIVAGGAPRDWFRGMPAKDLDIYINVPQGTDTMELKEVLETGSEGVPPTVHRRTANNPYIYDEFTSNHIMDVFDYVSMGDLVQLVVTDIDPVAVMKSFPINLSRAMYIRTGDGTGVSVFEDCFMRGMNEKSIVAMNRNYHLDYVTRIMEKFQDFTWHPYNGFGERRYT